MPVLSPRYPVGLESVSRGLVRKSESLRNIGAIWHIRLNEVLGGDKRYRYNQGGSRKKYLGAWPLIVWEATTAKRNYYRTNYINQ